MLLSFVSRDVVAEVARLGACSWELMRNRFFPYHLPSRPARHLFSFKLLKLNTETRVYCTRFGSLNLLYVCHMRTSINLRLCIV